MDPVAPGATEPVDPARTKWRAFAAVASTYILIVLSTALSFIVLSAIAEDFGVTLRAVSWVVIVESLIISACVLPLGAVADAFGRRRVLMGGQALFAVGMLLVGLAPTFGLLIAARIVSAIGNALVQSIGTGILVAAFPPEERGLALGAQTTAVAVGSAAAPLLGGVGLSILDWNHLFLILAVPSIAAVPFVAAMIPADRTAADGATTPGEPPQGRFDRVGSALSALAITVAVITISNPFSLSFSSPVIIGGIVAIVVLVAAFIRWELAVDHPMLELRLFRIPVFRQAVIIRAIGFMAATTNTVLFPVYLLSVRDVSTRTAGVLLFFVALGMGLSAQVSGRMYDRTGARPPTVFGLALLSATSVMCATFTADSSLVIFGFVAFLNGAAVGMWNVPMNGAMLGATPPESFGVGGAFTNVTRTIGNVLGQATATAIVVAVMSADGFDIPLDEVKDTVGATPAFIDGWRWAFVLAAAIPAALLVVALRLPDRAEEAASTQQPARS